MSTDNADPVVVLAVLRTCASAWEKDARIIGNIRACDIVRSLDRVLPELAMVKDFAGVDGASIPGKARRPQGQLKSIVLEALKNGPKFTNELTTSLGIHRQALRNLRDSGDIVSQKVGSDPVRIIWSLATIDAPSLPSGKAQTV